MTRVARFGQTLLFVYPLERKLNLQTASGLVRYVVRQKNFDLQTAKAFARMPAHREHHRGLLPITGSLPHRRLASLCGGFALQ